MKSVAEYFDLFVVPNFRVFTEAEADLSQWHSNNDINKVNAASRWALAAGMNASVPAYHMADAMLDVREGWPQWLSSDVLTVADLRIAIEKQYCRMLRGDAFVDDLTLLGAVVDAYKHITLRDKNRPVTSNRATIVTATGYGELGFGEGNFGGGDQVIIRRNKSTSRALSSVLQNVMDMWRRVLNRPVEQWGS